MKRILIAGLTGALGLSLAGAAASEAAPRPPTLRATPAADQGPAVTWGACADPAYAQHGIECASILVPLDYRHPGKRKIRLEISRRAHTSSAADYRGVILTNPGGPGGSGLSLPILQQYVPGTAANSYDWIGFDPRGVGLSTPALHCSNKLFGPDRPFYVPSTKARMKYWRAKTHAYAAACGRSVAKRLLPFMTTVDNARDMESIRKALGAEKISYYGFSWGTYLGAVYAQLFPKRVDRMVLDGVVDPGRVWYGANLDQDRAFDRNMDVYWHYLAGHDGAFHLGTHWKAIKRGYYAEVNRLKKHPSAGGKLGPDELADAMLDAGYYVYDWVDIGHAYSDLIHKNDGKALFGMYSDTNQGPDAENGYAVYDAVQCTDNPWPGWNRTERDSWRIHRTSPFLTWGNTWYNAPCLHWPVKAHHRLAITGKHLKSKVLLIAETKDAATPFSGALSMRRRYPTASLIAGVNGTTHAGSLSGVGCVDNTIATYLATGEVPARKKGNRADKLCPKVPAPQPGAASRMAAPAGGLPGVLRQALESAQRSMLVG